MANTLTSIFTSTPATEPVDAAHPNTGIIVQGTQAVTGGTWTVVHTGVTKTSTPPTIIGRLRNFTTITASIIASGNVVNNILITPTGTSATGTSGTAINVVVSSISNQGGYRLLVSDSAGGIYAQLYQGSTASFSHVGLTAGQTKYYKWQYVGNGAFYDDSALSTAFSGTTNAALANDYALLVVGDSTATSDYSPFSLTLIPLLNSGIANAGYAGTFTSTANTAISGQGLNTGAPNGLGMIGNFSTQVQGLYVAGKYNVLIVQGLLNTMSNEVAVNGETGAPTRVLNLLKQYITQIRSNNLNWRIITGSLTKRTNGLQPAQENQRAALNQALVDGFADGSLDVQAVARFGQDTRLSVPGPNLDGSATNWFKDYVHYTQQTLDVVVCPSYRDAFLSARFGLINPLPYTGAAITNLYLTRAQVLPVADKTAGISETATGSGIYSVPGSGASGDWSRAILFNAYMPATGSSRIGFKNAAADALNAIVGLTTAGTLPTGINIYNNFAPSFYQHEDNRVLVKATSGAGVYVPATVPTTLADGEFLFLVKNDGVITLAKTMDGNTYTTIHTFPGTYAANMYVQTALEAAVGKLYAPQGFELVLNSIVVASPGSVNGPITFVDNINQVNTNGIITTTGMAAGVWGATGRCTNLKIAAGTNGRVIMDFPAGVGAGFAMLGLSDVNTRVSYTAAAFRVAMWVNNYQSANYMHTVEGGTQFDPTPVTFANAARVFSINRVGSVLTFEGSDDGGTTWVVLRTFTYSSNADLFIVSDINQQGTMKNPRGTGMSNY